MIRDAKESHLVVTSHLSEMVDPLLFGRGFRRRGNSLRYFRKYEDANQKVEIALVHKRDARCLTIAEILPYLEFYIPSVNRTALEMVQDPRLLANAPKITLRQQLHIAVPRNRRTLWYYKNETKCAEALDSVGEALSLWGIPLLEEYSTPYGITSNYEKGDSRIFSQDHWYVYVSAAYLVQGYSASAKRVLDERLCGYWQRKEFAKAFEFVERLSS